MIKDLQKRYGLSHWSFLSILTFVFALVLLIPQYAVTNQDFFLDLSWKKSLNWVNAHSMYRYGSYIAYTYGPLGFLDYRMADNQHTYLLIVLFDVYLYANLLYIVKRFIPLRSPVAVITIILTIYFARGRFFLEPVYFAVYLCSLFSLMETGKYRWLLNAMVISVLSFFIKVNFGLIQLALLFPAVGYAIYLHREKTKSFILTMVATVALVPLLARPLHVDIAPYLHNAKEIIAGYNGAMIIPLDFLSIKILAAVLILAAYNLICLWHLYAGRFKPAEMIRYLFTTLFVALLFKYGFVRSDHYLYFFIYVVPTIAVHYLFETGNYKSSLGRLLPVACLCTAFFFFHMFPQAGWQEIKSALPYGYIKDLAGGSSSKFGFSAEVLKGETLPTRIKQQVGNATLDVSGAFTCIALANDMNYDPRPTIQSYCAYNQYLDSLNYAKYTSATAPAYLIFTNGSIDDRVPFWDEAFTKKAIMQWYSVVDSFTLADMSKPDSAGIPYLLLKRNKTPVTMMTEHVTSGEYKLWDRMPLDTAAGLQYLYADFKYTLFGKVKSFFYQPSLVYIQAGYQSGKTINYRAALPVISAGVPINKRVETTADARLFFDTYGIAGDKAIWIRFVTTDGHSFAPKFKYRLESVRFIPN